MADLTRRTHRCWRISLAGFLVVLLAQMFGVSPASAHNSLNESNPSNGAILNSAPSTWVLTFSKDVPLGSASAEIVTSSGVRTQLPTPTHGTDKKQVVFALPDGLTGDITGRWRLVGSDGHVVSARVNFSITVATVPQSEGDESSVTTTTIASQILSKEFVDSYTPEIVRYLIRFLGYVAIVLFGGLLFAETYLAKGVLRAPRAMETLLVSSGVLALAPLIQALIFLDDSKDVGVLSALGHLTSLFDTSAGSMMFLRVCTGLLLLGLVVRIRQSQEGFSSPIVFGTAFVYLFALTFAGHSRSMAWPLLGVPTGIVHTASIAVWLGGLAVFVLFVLPVVHLQDGFDAFRRFGDAAQIAVVTMIVTGVIQSLRLHGTFITLLTEGHGRWLLMKIVLVAVMLKIGDINRQRVIRRLPQTEIALEKRMSLLRRASLTEVANGGIVIAVSTVLATASFS